MTQYEDHNSHSTHDIRVAVQHAQEMLHHNAFAAAEQQGREILKSFPNEPNALFIIGVSLKGLARFSEARKTFQVLVKQTPKFALAHQELGFTLHALKQIRQAIISLKDAVNVDTHLIHSWKRLSELLLATGDSHASEQAYNSYLRFSAKHPLLGEALQAFIDGKLALSERHCHDYLKQSPNDVSALRLLAEIAIKLGVFGDAEHLLVRCLGLAPDYHLARLNYAHVLNKQEKSQQALLEIATLEKHQPNVPPQQILKAAILVRLGQFEDAIALYDSLIARLPEQANLYTSRGHALKTIGEQKAAIASYRQSIACAPSYGEAYWSLANLKTFRFEQSEIQLMKKQMEIEQLPALDQINICFALGKALEDNKEFEQSFHYYQLGNACKNTIERYDADETTALIERTITTCPSPVFENNDEQGCSKADPIFIVGLPRSGSTLLEQILASHSLVDGTKELPDIIAMVRKLSDRKKRHEISKYPEVIAKLSSEQRLALGNEYINKTRIHRGDAPFFIDKMPNNFAHIGLIKLILPNAKIIDARRQPMSACFSGFKQLFSTGQAFSYDLENIARYYQDYLHLMDHWQKVLPHQVLTVSYEDVVNDFENQVRQLLYFCGLPFEQNCLEFYNNARAVNTASSEQVRQPINTKGLDAWKPFEAFLTPLQSKLSSIL
ncbi:sulfotransferase [uncultured Paraglaciecola sp.]|jgi:predicted Zn-dependent protease|uniref:tetratricopeptide repeat-containing sulfotransferase family protein n=1 Tax=uncultured Paraglaciecola sp. TaxID=1765024 RepID=UPI0025E7564F|nr:sulfotransferase [uncultured Paraglaciecola sp.]